MLKAHSKARTPVPKVSKVMKRTVCESASEFDPSFLRQFNELPRRSAFGPHAE
jgi:hypothetical protein